MFRNLFKKAPPPTRTPMETAQDICDLANAIRPDLPMGVTFWVDWESRPPQLTLRQRTNGVRIY